jgi:hypothetical protein
MFFMYKGQSLEYTDVDDMFWRYVTTREYGNVVLPNGEEPLTTVEDGHKWWAFRQDSDAQRLNSPAIGIINTAMSGNNRLLIALKALESMNITPEQLAMILTYPGEITTPEDIAKFKEFATEFLQVSASKDDGYVKYYRPGAVKGVEITTLTGTAEDMHDLLSHRDAWRSCIELAMRNAPPPTVDTNDQAYYAHELAVFDRVFGKLNSIVYPAPQPILPLPSSANWATAARDKAAGLGL